jgi:hypothetical protein
MVRMIFLAPIHCPTIEITNCSLGPDILPDKRGHQLFSWPRYKARQKRSPTVLLAPIYCPTKEITNCSLGPDILPDKRDHQLFSWPRCTARQKRSPIVLFAPIYCPTKEITNGSPVGWLNHAKQWAPLYI